MNPQRSLQRGASLVETLIVVPTLLMVVMAIWQAAMVFRARSAVNYAVFEAARAGAVQHARVASIQAAFQKAMIPYYGGGRDAAELAQSAARAVADLTPVTLRIRIQSPTQESFDDYASPELSQRLKVRQAVLPNAALEQLSCPRDVPNCNSDPRRNASGQSLADANLLKLHVAYGIPVAKQMPLVGPFYTWALSMLGTGADDPFIAGLIAEGRIPVVSQVIVRMQSEAILNTAMISDPGPGNGGDPKDPGDPPDQPPLPPCPWWDPTCSHCANKPDDPNCKPPDPCPGGVCDPCIPKLNPGGGQA